MSHGAAPVELSDNFRQYDVATNTITASFNTNAVDDEGPALNRLFYITLAVENTGTLPSVSTFTYDGVAMTLEDTISLAGAGPRLTIFTYYMLDADLPATPGLKDLVVTVTGGTTHSMVVGGGHYKNIHQIDGSTSVTNSETSPSNLIQINNAKSIDEIYIGHYASGFDEGGMTFNNGQVAAFEWPSLVHKAAQAYNNSDSSISTPWECDTNTTGDKMVAVGSTWTSVPDTDILYATAISVQSIVTADLTRTKPFTTTIAAASAVTVDLQRDRGYVTSLAVTSTVTSDVVRLVDFFGSLTESATVVSPTFKKDSALSTVVNPVVTVSGVFNATRPLASITNAELVVTASFGHTFTENISSLTPGCYIELFEIDTTVIGGGDIFRFIPGGYDVAEVQWQGNEYIRFPVQIDGFEWNATSQAPPQPTLKLSNVNKFVLAAVITLGDLVGAKVTRWRTYAQYLDDGEQADANAHFPPDIYRVQQKTGHTKLFIEWMLSSTLDLPGVRLPKRQILRDETTGNVYAPGVSKVRFKGR